mgnify:CR=1 FL=1
MRSTVRHERSTVPLEDQLVFVAPTKARLEPQTVPAGARRKPWRVVVANKIESVPGSAAINEGSRALGGVVREETVQVPTIPVIRGALELRRLHPGFIAPPSPGPAPAFQARSSARPSSASSCCSPPPSRCSR